MAGTAHRTVAPQSRVRWSRSVVADPLRHLRPAPDGGLRKAMEATTERLVQCQRDCLAMHATVFVRRDSEAQEQFALHVKELVLAEEYYRARLRGDESAAAAMLEAVYRRLGEHAERGFLGA